MRTPTKGSLPVAGRPGPHFFGLTVIDFAMEIG
jgi:hypothetical protein